MRVAGRRLGIVISGWLALPCAATADPPSASVGPLRAVEIDYSALRPLTRTTMRRELRETLAPHSLAVSWRTALASDETQLDELSFCFLSRVGVGGDSGALASTANRASVRTTWVYVPTVLATLGLDPDAIVTSFDAQRQMGVALGRVLAHEIVHAIAPAVEHAQSGLMRPRLHAFQLVRGSLALEAEGAERLAAGARDWLAHGARPAADGSPDR